MNQANQRGSGGFGRAMVRSLGTVCWVGALCSGALALQNHSNAGGFWVITVGWVLCYSFIKRLQQRL